MKFGSKKHNQTVMRELHNEGIEMTPEQLEKLRPAAYAKLRRQLKKLGITAPEGDEALFHWLRNLARRTDG